MGPIYFSGLLALLPLLAWSVSGSRILVLLPMSSKSHKNVFDPLVEELIVNRGHEVTFVSIFQTKPIPGLTTVHLEKPMEILDEITSNGFMFNVSASGNLNLIWSFLTMTQKACTAVATDPAFLKFLEDPGTYDVVLASSFFGECSLGLVPTFRAPLILVSPSTMFLHDAWATNTPFPLSYVPNIFLPFSPKMSFIQRVVNTVTGFAFMAFHNRFLVSAADQVVHKHFPNAVSSTAMLDAASLYLVNAHFSLDGPKPSMPNVIDVGGMHCRPGQKLQDDFPKFVNGSGDDGFIVFSLGSVLKGKFLPRTLVDIFIYAFSKLKQRVVWKYEEKLEGLPENVMITDWLPQQDLIAHPKCKLAITHGGLLSLQEVAYHGVPLLGMPLGADRDGNLVRATLSGFAKSIDWKSVTKDELLETIRELLTDKYKERARTISKLMKDRPQPAVETAAYWVDYVIRHNGAPHLKSAAEDLNIFQYLLIDVFAFLLILAITIGIIGCYSCKLLLSCLRRNHKKIKTQ